MTFLADMYSFLDPSGRTVLFSVDDCRLFPVDCVIGLICMVGECWLAIFRQTGYALTRRGQLSVESSLRPLSWCNSWSSHQNSEELSTSFFWWRSPDEIEMSKWGNKCLVVIYEFLAVKVLYYFSVLFWVQLPPIIEANFPVERGNQSIMGHRWVCIVMIIC